VDRRERSSEPASPPAADFAGAGAARPKISVFGATGFIGSRFVELYPEFAYAEPRDSERPAHADILYLISTTHNFHVLDDLAIDIETNLAKLARVLEACRGRDVTFNFVSSWFVYGPQTALPVREDAMCRPDGFYSITKKCAEDLLSSFCRTFGKRYRILRLSNVYGPGDRVSARKNGLQYMLQRLVRDEPVELYARGEATRDYLYVDDVCRALALCAERAPLGAVTNVGSGEPLKLAELVEYGRARLGSRSSLNLVETPDLTRQLQVKNFHLDVSRLKSLGFVPSVTWQSGLDRVLNAELAAIGRPPLVPA
jgi:nucleoside-diphosphate-sugar epimerase